VSAERKWAFRIEHVLEAIAKIRRYTEGMRFDEFQKDERTVDAVIRNFLVIGEAVGQVPADVKKRYPEVPWSRIQGMRHVLVHDYDEIKLDIVWRTIEENLPPLVDQLEAVLREEMTACEKTSF